RLDWPQPGKTIVDHIRGLSPYPAAWTTLRREDDGEETTAKIFAARFEPCDHGQPCGTIESDCRTFVRAACADGWIALEELQIAGKKRLPVKELLLGWRDVLQYRFGE
ncbi:MAG: methionyl-tRNA formyltransferase, partial [Alistipes sp.]|nr:methionyl-tRNA formyltransferase [Alistipes sp.]